MARKNKLKSLEEKILEADVDYQRREITVGSYVVKEAAMREAIRRTNMAQSVQRRLKEIDDEELMQALVVYPHIAGCVWPIISIEQWLEIPEVVLDELSKAAQELNPHWFVFPDQEKKTDEQQATYTTSSET